MCLCESTVKWQMPREQERQQDSGIVAPGWRALWIFAIGCCKKETHWRVMEEERRAEAQRRNRAKDIILLLCCVYITQIMVTIFRVRVCVWDGDFWLLVSVCLIVVRCTGGRLGPHNNIPSSRHTNGRSLSLILFMAGRDYCHSRRCRRRRPHRLLNGFYFTWCEEA